MENTILDRLTDDSGFFLVPRSEIASFQSKYQQIRLIDTASFGLCLILDGKVQSTQADEFIYHEALVHPAMLAHPGPRSVFIAGGGEGATLREVLRHPTVEEVVMVDLDEEVVDICRRYLTSWHQGAFEDPRLRLVHMDARAVLDEEGKRYDVIVLDLSEPVDDGPSYLLFTQEFYELCRDRLQPGGVLVTQAGCPSLIYSLPFHSITVTMERVFGRVAPYEAFIPSFASNWGFTLASLGKLPPEVPEGERSKRLASLKGGLRFLDAGYLPAMFNQPKYQKENRGKVGRVIRDGKPLIVI
ncbi:MAG: fused MFS/spermidine synthase [bacterium]|nr:MAG: fused MFS/spermidine synthase [bacterium]